MLTRRPSLQPSLEPWPQASTQPSDAVLDMVGAVLENDLSKLEKLVIDNTTHINDPIGLPFDTPGSRFFGHPALNQMVFQQHPDQTLFDIACGMPCGPVIWVLLAYGAKGSKHPLGTDLALHNAIKNGRAYTVQALLQPGRSDANGVPGSTWKPIFQAVFWNKPAVVRVLLSRGADIKISGPSPHNPDTHNALQLCLEHRIMNYADPSTRERCHQIIELLINAGVDVHARLTLPEVQSILDMFIKPWQSRPYWAMEISSEELNCFRLFVGRGVNLQGSFTGLLCGSPSSNTFVHQALWHSTPAFARLLIDALPTMPTGSGTDLLQEVLGSCPDAKRHPADTLRDVQVLLVKGANPNFVDPNGITPLRKCIEQCPAVDLVARLQVLLEAGADPEAEDFNGVTPYVLAARIFEEPLLSEAMAALISKIQGRYVRRVNGVSSTWPSGIFPISGAQTYQQVMSCTRQTGNFQLNMRSMVPEDVQPIFQRAYFNVVSRNFLDTMTRLAKTKILNTREKDEIVWIVSMREGVDLPAYQFDQRLVVALLDPQPLPSMVLEPMADVANASTASASTTTTHEATTTSSSPASSTTLTAGISPAVSASVPAPACTPFQFNANHFTVEIPSASSASPPAPKSPQWVDDFFVESTTQIRWLDPCSKPKPGDAKKALEAVLILKCGVCDDGKLLTKKELERHEMEHEHSSGCDHEECTRRFCVARRRKEKMVIGCQDHLFGGQN
jgi:ankyrin repeat protein